MFSSTSFRLPVFRLAMTCPGGVSPRSHSIQEASSLAGSIGGFSTATSLVAVRRRSAGRRPTTRNWRSFTGIQRKRNGAEPAFVYRDTAEKERQLGWAAGLDAAHPHSTHSTHSTHTAHATHPTHAAAGHGRHGRLLLGLLGDECLGGEEQPRHGGGIL